MPLRPRAPEPAPEPSGAPRGDGTVHPLEVRDLVKDYDGTRAVQGVSFTIPRARIFCLVGPNGAGKTTTIECSQGLRRATAGEVRCFGEDPRRASRPLKRRIGLLPQRFSAYDTLTVRENLEYFADVYDVRPDVRQLLDSLGLAEVERARYSTLSGGTKRRVGIATALVNDPELVFLDEPTAGVDPANRRKLWDLILRMRADGRSVLLTTHYMDEAERLADEVAMIYRGRIVARGPPERVRLLAGGKVLIRGLRGALPDPLAARPGLHRENGTVTIPLRSPKEGPEIIAELVRRRVPYDEVAVHEPSLDDAFVEIVGRLEEAYEPTGD